VKQATVLAVNQSTVVCSELTLLVIMIRAPIDQPILRESSASPDLVGDRSQSLTLIAVPRSHGLDSICTSPRSLSDGQLAAI